MRRSSLPWLLVLLSALGCIDTAEPTGPVPIPDPGDGEIVATPASITSGDPSRGPEGDRYAAKTRARQTAR